MAVLAGCSSNGDSAPKEEVTEADPAAFTVSYRNHVRLPKDGENLTAEAYATQIRAKDPVASIRCGAEESAAYKDISSFLGGISWSHPVAIVKDSSLPPLYDAKHTQIDYPEAASAGASDSGAAPTIERPDLVGVQNGIGIFLSKQHGLMAVDARGPAPVLSCSMKLPGEPKNFLFHGNELVVVVNATSGNRSALLRYSFDGAKFHFVDAVRLEDQTITDARLFDSTIVLYTSWSKPQPPAQPTPTNAPGAGGGGGASSPAYYPGGYGGNHLGSKMIVVQWDSALAVDWEDSLLDDVAKQDPTEGTAPGTQYTAGQLVSEYKTFKSFVTASDRYIVVPRDVQKTRFTNYETYSYNVCTNYNPQYQQITQCSVNYEKRANPDYRAPDPATGDYSCNGKKLADCIVEAAPVVSQYVYVPVGQTCSPVWQGRCEKYETRTETYPRFETENETELVIYRFEGGSFTKLDSSLATMTAKDGAISFTTSPLTLKGQIANKNQVQFQNGHLYVFSDQALQTLAVAGNSTSYLARLNIQTNTAQNPSIAFSTDRAMISAVENTYPNTTSRVTMLDLSTPSLPTELNSFSMPGTSAQLILATGGILGPGQVSFGNQQVQRTLQKLTLFSKDAGAELDNLLLGTEYDTFESSWLDAQDDQRIRLGAGGTRLFLPYSGQHHANEYEPTAHRLNISRIDAGRLVSERSFAVSDDIIRTAPLDDARSLVFGNSAAYLVDHTSGDWALSTLREFFVPFATYRLNDASLHARISRVGSKCRITTHANDSAIFGDASLAQAEVPCSEYGAPTGFGANLLFSQTRTGVRISPDGLTIDTLTAAEVEALLAKLPPSGAYCYTPNADPAKNGMPVEYLDEVPAKILCAAAPATASGSGGSASGGDTATPAPGR